MPEFDTAHVKNIVLLGHTGCGKTTLAESMLFESGLIAKRGSIAQGNTIGDYHALEIERRNSIFSKLMFIKWRGYKINIIDTPGYDDFVGELLTALRVADTGVMVLNAIEGVEITCNTIWEYTEKFNTPMVFAINKLDDDKADFEKTLLEAKLHFGHKILVLQYPRKTGADFHEIIDVLRMTMYRFNSIGGKPEKLPIPSDEKDKANELHQKLVEAIAGNDVALMEKYFDKGELDEDELKVGLKNAMIHRDLFPLFCLSAEKNMGSGRLMGFIDNVCPSANEMPPQKTKNNELVPCSSDGPVCLFVYKIVNEPHVGELTFFKVYSGVVKAGMEFENGKTGAVERINQLFLVEGNKRTAVHEIAAGDIGATLKLKNTHVNNCLQVKGENIELLPIGFPSPNLVVAIESIKTDEQDKLSQALHELREEDPTLLVEVSPELKQTLLHLQGEMHLTVIRWKIEKQYKLSIRFNKPKIAYREAIRKTSEAAYRHKKQSGGSGQFAEVVLRIEPLLENMPEPANVTVRNKDVYALDWGGRLEFYNCIVGGAIDSRFLPSILKGVIEKMQDGPLIGAYARDIRVCVLDGKMHSVDSNDISFKIAGLQAFRLAFEQAGPQLLEPIYQLEVLCPNFIMGSVINDLQTRRAVMGGIDNDGYFQKIRARVPLAEMDGFSSSLKSITKGRSKFKMHFHNYEAVTAEQQKKLINEHTAELKEMVM